MEKRELHLTFTHGLGDCANFGKALLLWRECGFDIQVSIHENKRWLWNALGFAASSSDQIGLSVPFDHPPQFNSVDANEFQGNKTAWNLCLPPMPYIGEREPLWNALNDLTINLKPCIKPEAFNEVSKFLKRLPRPVILLHSHGTTWPEMKCIPDKSCIPIYDAILDSCGGSLVLLDWDNRVPLMPHGRIRHLKKDWGHIGLENLAALLSEADLFIGVDSGPLHFAGLFPDTPVLGIWTLLLPWHLGLKPGPNTVHLMPARVGNKAHRWVWHLAEWTDPRREIFLGPDPADVALWAKALLAGPIFLPRFYKAVDITFQNIFRKLRTSTPSSSRSDRDVTVSAVLRLLEGRQDPFIVETGCVRAPDDWGAGCFGYIISAWIRYNGKGYLACVDISKDNLKVAKDVIGPDQPRVAFINEDSVIWLMQNKTPIDLLYLDALDTDFPDHAEHCLSEAKAAQNSLKSDSYILIDDTPWECGGWRGKGRLAIPWLLENGWQILESSYQVLVKKEKP